MSRRAGRNKPALFLEDQAAVAGRMLTSPLAFGPPDGGFVMSTCYWFSLFQMNALFRYGIVDFKIKLLSIP
ncbi:hypothetical protein CDA63_01350 [Hymenobacter amundsenii]|uniref:Uncharacterized protein n=1 Tax=Hymenobacter amundsenii TaxID=2006685 RepID=A0A246FQL6_9BACT|nr:hypothetical protein CDA63_01350 [Hymenobacter amundsenii]